MAQSPADTSAPAVASTPVAAAEPPPVAEAPKPTENPSTEKPSPAEQAAQNALKQRIAEMDNAEVLQREVVNHQQRLAAEPQPQPPPQQQQQLMTTEEAVASLPERARRWFKARPELFTEPEGAARLQYAHWVAKRETGEELTEKYFDRMDHLLGFRQQQPAQPKPAPTQENKVNGHAPVSAPAAPRDAAPVRQQQQRPGPSVSAPPTRTAPSMTTGRPINHHPPLTADEVALAAHLKISPEEYALQKDKMQRLKAAGAIQN
jgi:hypothetical protein